MEREHEVEVLGTGESVTHRISVTRRPLQVGRAPTNDLALTHETVSWHHLTLWIEGGVMWVRDLESRNGTFVNGRLIRGAERLGARDVVRMGTTSTLRVAETAANASTRRKVFMLEDMEAGLRFPVMGNRMHLGSGDDADLFLEHAPERAATLLIDGDQVTLGTDTVEFPIKVNQWFEVAGRKLRLVPAQDAAVPTVDAVGKGYTYRLRATLNGASGPEATFEDLRKGITHLISADNPAVLLYLLAKKRSEDLESGAPEAERGWCSDDDVATGIWGRGGGHDPNSLHVLVYRVRKELKKAGFDPWFIEKRRRAIRLCLHDIEVR